MQTIRSEHDNNHKELRQALENNDINGDYSDDDDDDDGDGDDGGDDYDDLIFDCDGRHNAHNEEW